MIKPFLTVAIAALLLNGCATNNTLSADTFSASQAKQIQTVTFGTLTSVRPVTIQGGDNNNIIGTLSGAVIGGLLGSTIGGGSGRNLGAAAGAVAGGVVGQGVQSMMSRSEGVELEIRRDDGSSIVVVQKQGPTQFRVGQRVMIASSSSGVTVSPN